MDTSTRTLHTSGTGRTLPAKGEKRLLRTTTVGRAGVIAAAAALLGGGTAAATTGADAAHHHHHRGALSMWHTPGAFGKVTSVDGSSATGACGVAGATGTFDVARKGKTATATTTVDVTSATKFLEPGTQTASFADLCVGFDAGAVGTTGGTGGTLTASGVWMASPSTPPAPAPKPPLAYGKVASVDGSSATGACGVAGATGTFGISGWKATTTRTVDVTSSTKFVEKGSTTASFADVCVGDDAGAVGTATAAGTTPKTPFTASGVWIAPAVTRPAPVPRPPAAFGKVTSVDGSSATGACGVAGTTGTFDVAGWKSTAATTVDVTKTTKFAELGNATASFADLCVGDDAGAAGTTSGTGGTLTAAGVWISSTARPPMPAAHAWWQPQSSFSHHWATPVAPTSVAAPAARPAPAPASTRPQGQPDGWQAPQGNPQSQQSPGYGQGGYGGYGGYGGHDGGSQGGYGQGGYGGGYGH
ncbi:MAG: hypothetical protein ACRDWE_12695 [Acidimicrobiales bacterium]